MSADELVLAASAANLPAAQSYVEEHLEAVDCPLQVRMQIALAVEEIFVNICSYAYAPGQGLVTLQLELSREPAAVTITFLDSGKPYDPLAKENPDLTIPAEDRPVGGLGIFMTKAVMDDVTYVFRDGQNVLKLVKKL